MISKFIHINMPTKNVAAARGFYSALGFTVNEEYSTEQNVFIALAENVNLILATEDFLRQLGERRDFVDATKATEASLAISMNSREDVDALFEAAIAAGGVQAGDVVEEKEICLYARAFFDLDGHKVDINHMPF